jgi:formylglycine-generating enzyme required for sulfatase activity
MLLFLAAAPPVAAQSGQNASPWDPDAQSRDRGSSPPAASPAGQRQDAVDQQLEAARRALREGRLASPPHDNAWSYFNAALELDPHNAEAQAGLAEVQGALIERAMSYAQELDFEAAERILETADEVHDSEEAIADAREEISRFRAAQAAALEARAVEAIEAGEFSRAELLLVDLIALGGAEQSVGELRRKLEQAMVYGGLRPGQAIRDPFLEGELWAPESVVIAAGSFVMGSPAAEKGRKENEGPQRRVAFEQGFLIGRTEVTVGQFREFVQLAHYRTDAEKKGFSHVYDHHSGRLARRSRTSWRHDYEGNPSRDEEPVVHVSWNDAAAFARWLAEGTGKAYRLPSESEFEYALRAGRKSRYWWGEGAPRAALENLTGQGDLSRSRRQWTTYFAGYEDGHWGPAPAASFQANPFGLHDMGGNVGEWVSDCWHDGYLRAPTDGSAWINPGCRLRVIRGGYWASAPDQARSAYRLSAQPDRSDARIGFRIARDL